MAKNSAGRATAATACRAALAVVPVARGGRPIARHRAPGCVGGQTQARWCHAAVRCLHAAPCPRGGARAPRSGPAGSRKPLPMPWSLKMQISRSRRSARCLQAVVADDHIGIGVGCQQRACSDDAPGPQTPAPCRPPLRCGQSNRRLVAHLAGRAVGLHGAAVLCAATVTARDHARAQTTRLQGV